MHEAGCEVHASESAAAAGTLGAWLRSEVATMRQVTGTDRERTHAGRSGARRASRPRLPGARGAGFGIGPGGEATSLTAVAPKASFGGLHLTADGKEWR